MNLKLLKQAISLDELLPMINEYFGFKARLIPCENSVFLTWLVRPKNHIHVSGIWKYRVAYQHGTYYFGEITEMEKAASEEINVTV
jgi:hypothetical protein